MKLKKLMNDFLQNYLEENGIQFEDWSINVNNQDGFGDYSSNIALKLTKQLIKFKISMDILFVGFADIVHHAAQLDEGASCALRKPSAGPNSGPTFNETGNCIMYSKRIVGPLIKEMIGDTMKVKMMYTHLITQKEEGSKFSEIIGERVFKDSTYVILK